MDQTLNMLGMTSMFVGGFTALILDNMISGASFLQVRFEISGLALPFCCQAWATQLIVLMIGY